MITIDNLTVQFGGVRPIDSLTARLTAPVAGLIGPNGAGKTTLLNVLSGFITPRHGSVLMNDIVLTDLSPIRRVRAGVRRTFQTEQVVEDLTIYQNVAAIADNVTPRLGRNEDIARAIDYIGLARQQAMLGADLNLFQRRLLELAKCLVGRPTLILLDEPAAGLTDEESAKLRDLVAGVPDEYSAQVIVIDHDVDLIRSLCTETLVLDYGRLLAVGETNEILASSVVRRAYLGEPVDGE